ncbi:MAG: phasin family protein [Lautropia sp.]|nr:phasin family protein [Lautropia sp.]
MTQPLAPQAQTLLDLNHQAIETAHQLSQIAFSSLEKLVQLNTQAIKANWEEQVSRSAALLEARGAQSLNEALTQGTTPANEKLAAYTQHLFNISQETATEMQKVLEKQFGEQGRQIQAVVEQMGKSMPKGFDGIMPMFRQAVDSANDVVDQYNKNSRQIVDMAEAQFNEAAATVRSVGTRRKTA